jgi:hypothetical protein
VAAATSETMVTIDKESVKTVDGLQIALRQLEVLTAEGTLTFVGVPPGDYQGPCRRTSLVVNSD